VKKTTFALPAGSPFADAFASEARSAGRELALGAHGRAAGDGGPDGTAVPWDPPSFASARTAVIEGENALGGTLDELVVFADPPADGHSFPETAPREIEAAALSWAAGHAWLIREAMRRMIERGGGTVALVLPAREARGALGSMAAGALEGLATGLLAAPESRCRFMFIRDESAQPEALARFVLRSLDDPPRDAGKALRHGGKPAIFGR